MTRRAVLLAAWTTALAAIGCVLLRAGHGTLALPSGASVAALRAWASSRDPATVAMSGLRVVAMILDGYLLLTTLAGAAARGARWASGIRALDVLSPAVVRRVLALSLGGLLLAGPVVGGATTAFAAPAPIVLAPAADGPPLVRVSPPPGSPSAIAPRLEDGTAPPRTPPVGPRASSPTTGGSPTSRGAPTRATSGDADATGATGATGASTPSNATNAGNATGAAPTTTAAPGAERTWVVARGDNFW